MTANPSLFDQGPGDGAWSVGQLTRAVKRLVEGQLAPVWVRGEILGLKVYQSGHWYFTLRDAEAQVRCVMWRTQARRAGPPLADGTPVFALAAPSLWEERGEFRLTIQQLLPTAGVGDQQLALEKIKAALQRDGLLDPARKRRLPPLVTRLAVVTSLDGAALHDIVTVARKRWPAVELLVVGSRVQGEGAEAELVRALGVAGRLAVDCCIVGRGGGAREDLAAFNSEAVCRAIAAMPVPTIAAVGHETDITLTDLVADIRAATPSAAAELAVPDRVEWLARTDHLAERLATGLTRRTRLGSERLARSGDRLQAALERLVERRRRQTEQVAAQLDALSPLRVLQRGYSVARDASGRVLRRRADFPAGQAFRLRVTDGEIPARAAEEGP